MEALFGPTFILAVVFTAFAAFDWERVPLCARASLAVGTVFAVAGLQHPGMTLNEVLEKTHDGMTYVVAIARPVGFAAVLASAILLVRDLADGTSRG